MCLSCVFKVRIENHVNKGTQNILLAAKRKKGPWSLVTTIAAAVAALIWNYHGRIYVNTTAHDKEAKCPREGGSQSATPHS